MVIESFDFVGIFWLWIFGFVFSENRRDLLVQHFPGDQWRNILSNRVVCDYLWLGEGGNLYLSGGTAGTMGADFVGVFGFVLYFYQYGDLEVVGGVKILEEIVRAAGEACAIIKSPYSTIYDSQSRVRWFFKHFG